MILLINNTDSILITFIIEIDYNKKRTKQSMFKNGLPTYGAPYH